MYDCIPRFVPFTYKFTGKERDTESGLDYFGARRYASSMGRWMSPDWSDPAQPVPYAWHMGAPAFAQQWRVAKGTISSFSCDMTRNPNTGLPNNGFTETAGYVPGPDGSQLTEVDGGGNWVHTNVYAAGGLIATYDPDGLHFHLNDWLGTRRVDTDYAGNPESTYHSLPFGEMDPSTQIISNTEHFFTGKERDAESGLHYFGARCYGSSMGRFMSPICRA